MANTHIVSEVDVFEINSAISPATLDYLKSNLSKLPNEALVLVKINTPGGLITTTKEIITLLSNQHRPVVFWVTPEGASAASAGAIIASSAHLIYMSPGTSIGAATPVGLNEDIKESDGKNKAINDLTATVKALSEARGRNSTPFGQMIKNATSYTDQEALKLKIINGIASTQSEILEKINKSSITIQGKNVTVEFKDHMEVKIITQTLGQEILEVLANPTTAYFLFLIGVALIYFELQAPGGFIAGTVGVCFLLLAGVAFQVLPLNWGAMGLIGAGVAFLIMEVFIISYGLLSLLGVSSFVVGSLFLFDSESGFISVQYPVLISTLLAVVFSAVVIVFYLYKEKKKTPPPSNFFLPIGAHGIVLQKSSEGHYQVRVQGEIWNATSSDILNIGDKISVESVSPTQLNVHVKKFTAL